MSEAVPKQNGLQAWAVAIVVTLGGIIAAASVMKINPCAALIMQDLGIGESLEGVLLSVCSIVGVIIAIPAGALMNKFGPRVLGIVSLVITILGGLVGSLTSDYTVLLISRIFEGFAFGTWAVLGPVFISAWFTPNRRGLPMGIFSVWVGWCMLFIFRVANLVIDAADPSSWHNVWWLTVIGGVIVLVLFILIARLPKGAANEEAPKQDAEKAPAGSAISALKSVPVWCIIILFLIFSWSQQVMTGFTATYNIQNGADVIMANIITSNWTLGNVVGALLVGALLNKLTKSSQRGYLIIFVAVCSLVTYATIFRYPLDIASTYLLITGFLCIMFTPIGFNSIPDIVDNPKQMGFVLALASCMSMVGHVLVVTGGIAIEFSGYAGCMNMLIVLGVIYLAVAIIFTVSVKKREKRLQA